MEYPDIQVPGVPAGGIEGGGVYHGCPRVDQWIPVENGVKRAGEIKKRDLLHDPLTGRFERVKSAEILKNRQIFEIIASNGVAGYSSGSHPVFPYSEHENGIPVSKLYRGDPILLWHSVLDELIDRTLTVAHDTGTIGDVVRIELESGHVYAYGTSKVIFIVCHNAKYPVDI